MGGTTPTHGLPYPTGSDRVAEGDNAIQALAVKLDSELSERDATIGAQGTTISNQGTTITANAAKVDQRARFVTTTVARYVAATFSIPSVPSMGSVGPTTVTFPAGSGFTSAPVVVAIPSSGRMGLAITATTTTGFTYVADNWSPATAGAATARYIAVGPGA
jgi:hypothetical protein